MADVYVIESEEIVKPNARFLKGIGWGDEINFLVVLGRTQLPHSYTMTDSKFGCRVFFDVEEGSKFLGEENIDKLVGEGEFIEGKCLESISQGE